MDSSSTEGFLDFKDPYSRAKKYEFDRQVALSGGWCFKPRDKQIVHHSTVHQDTKLDLLNNIQFTRNTNRLTIPNKNNNHSNYSNNNYSWNKNKNYESPKPRNNYYSSKNPDISVRGPRSVRVDKAIFDRYNRAEFEVNYERAKFFMIKSYSEDNVHNGIKYNVWASTQNGNKKLDMAFHNAQIFMKERDRNAQCPVFLFFSVNSSGQFVGLAEMVGPVDFKKSMDFWEQSKLWSGFFPVKWHVVKDIPNSLFRNITLENNENKVVTFSRDTQEIGLPQGLKMLQIFKDYQGETSILDDFEFYENKEKMRRHNRIPSFNFKSEFAGMDGSLEFVEGGMRNMSLGPRNRQDYRPNIY